MKTVLIAEEGRGKNGGRMNRKNATDKRKRIQGGNIHLSASARKSRRVRKRRKQNKIGFPQCQEGARLKKGMAKIRELKGRGGSLEPRRTKLSLEGEANS